MLLLGCLYFINKPVWLIPVYIISSLSTTYFVAGDGLGISRLIGFIIIIAGLLKLVKGKAQINSNHFRFLIVILVYGYFSSLHSITGTMKPIISLAQNLMVLFLISTFTRVNIELLSKVLVISSLFGIIFLRINLNELIGDVDLNRLSISENVNENRFAMMLAQLTSIVFFGFLIAFKSKTWRFILLIGLIAGFFMLILSGSRSAIIGALGASLIVLFLYFREKIYKFIIPAIILAFSSYFLINYLQDSQYTVLDRFSVEKVQETGGTGRLENWKKLVPVVLNNKVIIGYGIGGENSYQFAQNHGLEHAAHNFLIDMFIQLGLIGVILLFSYYIFSLKRLFKKLNNNYFLLLPLILFFTGLLNGIGETIYIEKHFWNSIALVWLFSNNSSSLFGLNKIKKSRE